MLISVLGNLGSGKTLFLTYLATKFNRDVHSNYEIKVKHYKPLKVIDLLHLPNNIEVFIDEAYTWLESRVSSKALNRYLSYILLQSRKRTINIYITAQLFSSVDVRFREQSNIIIVCSKVDNGFFYKILNRDNNGVKTLLFPFEKAKNYYKYFDTHEIIEPYDKDKLEFNLLQSDTELLFNTSRNIARKIHDKIEGNKYTHHNVKLALLENGYDKNFEPYVYSFLHSENFDKNKDVDK